MDAKAMAEALKGPVVMLPRFAWVPLIGRWLGRKLPARKYVGKILSYIEFMPFQAEFTRAQETMCEGCGETLKVPSEPPEGIELPEYLGCRCDEPPRPKRRVEEEEFKNVCVAFIRAQGFPVRAVMALPGQVLHQVLMHFFWVQTGASLPREIAALMNGSDLPSRASAEPEVRKTVEELSG